MAGRNSRKLYNLGSAMRLSRERKGVSLGTMATELDCDKGNLSRIENGERLPELKLLCAYADFLGISASAYLADGGEAAGNLQQLEQCLQEEKERISRLTPEKLASLMNIIRQTLIMAEG